MSAESPLRLDAAELYSERVEQFLGERAMLHRAEPPEPPPRWFVRIFYATWFYLSLAGGLGAFVAWAIMEPFFHDDDIVVPGQGLDAQALISFLIFPIVVGCVGLFLGAAEGIVCRNPRRAFISAVVGMAIGFVGGLIATFLANIIFTVSILLAVSVAKGDIPEGEMPRGFPFLILMMGRATAWAIAGIPAGIGQGIAVWNRKVIVNGLLGGVLGGLLGGLIFDPINLLITGPAGSAEPSRAVGFTVIGLLVGLFVGLVEQWTKKAWLLMRAGPLAGKQFVLSRSPTVLGSSPKADVYLFKDSAIEPKHALIHQHGGRCTIEDCGTAEGTLVNGTPVKKQVLQPGDRITLGKTVFEFAIREAT